MIAGYHHGLSMADYLRDPCPEPSLSTGVVETLTQRTPFHAHREHPRFGGRPSDPTTRTDIGTAIHSLVLGGEPVRYIGEVTKRSGKDKGVKFIANDWATQDAKDARDEIRASGGIPLLEHQREGVELAAAAAARVLASLGTGKSEVTMLWQQPVDLGVGEVLTREETERALETRPSVWCRGRADWLSDGPVTIGKDYFPGGVDVDIKTVENADAYDWARRTIVSCALDVQSSLRSMGHRVLTGRPREMLWLLVELETAQVSLVGVGNENLDLGERKIIRAGKIWRQCLDANTWPGYPTDVVHYVDPPAYAKWDFAMREGAQP